MGITNFDAVKATTMGKYTVVAADDTANTKSINLATAFGTDIPTGFIVQILRSNVTVTGDAVITLNTTTKVLTVADGSTYVLTTGDVINYIVY